MQNEEFEIVALQLRYHLAGGVLLIVLGIITLRYHGIPSRGGGAEGIPGDTRPPPPPKKKDVSGRNRRAMSYHTKSIPIAFYSFILRN